MEFSVPDSRFIHRPITTICIISGMMCACTTGTYLLEVEELAGETDRFPSAVQGYQSIPDIERHNVWWQRALDDKLGATLLSVVQSSPQLSEASARVKNAEAVLNRNEAERRISVLLSGDAGGERNSVSSASSASINAEIIQPLDLFGRLQAARDAAEFDLLATVANYEQSVLEVIQEYLFIYIDFAESNLLIDLINNQLNSSRTLLTLTELRFVQGQSSIVDVLQQREQVASLEQQLPAPISARQEALNRMTALSGTAPIQTATQSAGKLPEIEASFAVRRPKDLLITRPDLQASRASLYAADFRYAEALKDRLPSLTFSSNALTRILAGDATSLIAATLNAAYSLFDSGRLTAVASEARANVEAAGALYLRAWLNAVADVDTLMSQEQRDLKQLKLSAKRIDTARALLKATQQRYRQGASDYLPVLDSLQSLQQQEREHLSLQTGLLRTRIALHTALGLPKMTGER